MKTPYSRPQRILDGFELQEGEFSGGKMESDLVEQQIQEQQIGESLGCEQGCINMGTFGHLWCVLGDTKRAGLCQARKSKAEEISFLSYHSHPQGIYRP